MATRKTQAQWDKDRAEVKKKAAKVVKENAVEALEAKKKAQAQAPSAGNEDFLKKAREIEKQINAPVEEPEVTEEVKTPVKTEAKTPKTTKAKTPKVEVTTAPAKVEEVKS